MIIFQRENLTKLNRKLKLEEKHFNKINMTAVIYILSHTSHTFSVLYNFYEKKIKIGLIPK